MFTRAQQYSLPQTAPVFRPIKTMIAAALIALSLVAGAGGSANRAEAASLHAGPVTTPPEARMRTHCRVIDYLTWNLLYPDDPSDVGGMYCWKA